MPLCHWTNQIKSVFPNLAKPQATVLAAFRFGVAKAKSRALNEVARGLTFLGIPDMVETRLRRFISNPRVDMEESCKFIDRLKAVVVSVACEGRADRGGDDDVSSD